MQLINNPLRLYDPSLFKVTGSRRSHQPAVTLLRRCRQVARGTFIDPSDGQFDVNRWMAGKSGVLPVPTIITESAVRCGGEAALL